MKEIDATIEVFFGAVGFFDFEGVKCFGMNNTKNFFFVIYDGKIGKTGFVKFV